MKFPLSCYVRIGFKSLETNLKTLFSRVSLANWFVSIFCIFICSFPDINLFLINRNLFRFRNSLGTFSTHFYLFANRFCLFLLAYHLSVVSACRRAVLLVSTHWSDVSTRLPLASHFSAYARKICKFQHK